MAIKKKTTMRNRTKTKTGNKKTIRNRIKDKTTKIGKVTIKIQIKNGTKIPPNKMNNYDYINNINNNIHIIQYYITNHTHS